MKNTKKAVLITLALLLVLGAVGATVAWMSAESELSNVFTVGQFKDPDGTGPTYPTEPGETYPEWPEDPDTDPRLDGNLYEPNWDPDDAKMVPGATIVKDPYVGIGEGSEDAYVYVYVKPTMPNVNGTIGFYINEGWAPVADFVDMNGKYEKDDDSDPATDEHFYTEGLFVYTGGLTGSADAEVWTNTPVFSEIIVQGDATIEDLGDGTAANNTIEVKAFIHQKTSGDNSDLADTALTAAKTTLCNNVTITETTNSGYAQTKN